MATFIARALELAPVSEGGFSDGAGTTHAENINAVAAAGSAGGYSDGTYRPGTEVNRGQMATFIVRGFLGYRLLREGHPEVGRLLGGLLGEDVLDDEGVADELVVGGEPLRVALDVEQLLGQQDQLLGRRGVVGLHQLHALGDRKRVVEGKSVSGRVDLGGRRIIKKKRQQDTEQ